MTEPKTGWFTPARRETALRVALYLIILWGCGFRLTEAYFHNPMNHLFSDPLRHWDHGKNPLLTSPIALIDPPVFQIWISIVQKITLGDKLLVGAYAGLLSVVTPWLWYRFLREFLRSPMLALVGWAALVWLPPWITIFSYTMTETLFLTLMGASLWQSARAYKKLTVGSFSWMVALWTLAGMTRGIGIPLAGMCGIWVWLRHPKKLKVIGWSLVIVGAMMIPIAARNATFINLASPIGSGWMNQVYAESGKKNMRLSLTRDGTHWNYEFGSPSLYARQLAPLSTWAPSRTGTLKIDVDLRKGARDWKALSERSAARGMDRLRLRWENTILVMLGESWPDNNRAYPIARVAVGMRWIFAPMMVILLILAAVRWRATLARPLIPVLMLTWFIFQGPSLMAVNEGRYRKPLEGLVIIQVLVIADQILERRRSARLLRAAFASLPAADRA